MKYSLFRKYDVIESFSLYLICFLSDSLLTFFKNLKPEDNDMVYIFLKSISDFQIIVIIFLSLILLVFHYKILTKRKTEIFCRILVGDTKSAIKRRYMIHSFSILFISFLLITTLNLIIQTNPFSNLYLLCIFVAYILVSTSKVQIYENI